MSDKNILTCGMIIKEARIKKEMTINDVAFELDKNNIKYWEKKIKSWESNKSYLTLEEMYKISYVLDINPTDLLIFRDKNRQNFIKPNNEIKDKKGLAEETKENIYFFLQFFARVIIIVIFIVFAIYYVRAANTLTNGTDLMVLDKINYDINTAMGTNDIDNNSIDNTDENVQNIY